MDFMIFCSITVIESIGVLFVGSIGVIKALADVGYKVDTDKLEDVIGFTVEKEHVRFSLVTPLIPIYNIISTVHFMKRISDTKYSNVDLLRAKGILEEMTDEEKEQYFRKPTFLNALMISMDSTARKDNDLKPISFSRSIKEEKELTKEEYVDCGGKLANDMKEYITLDKKKLTKEELISKKKNILNQMRELKNDPNNYEVKIELPQPDEKMGRIKQIKELRKMMKQMKDLLKYLEENENLDIDSQIIEKEEKEIKTYKK